MTTFHDALSGKKTEFSFPTKTPKSAHVNKPWCEGMKSLWDHSFKASPEETDVCRNCGASVLRVRALRNLTK